VSEKTYLYRREDNGEVVELPWPAPLDQVGGYVTLPDGVAAKRCLYLELERDGRPEKSKQPEIVDREIVSDNMGFGQSVYAEYEADRQRHGFTGVSFQPDPQTPEFFRVHCSSRRTYDRYLKHRGLVNRTGIGGVRLTQEDLDRAATLVGGGRKSSR
jgi:hypothetical protein